MGHVRVTKADYLYFDFFYEGSRYKEYTELKNNPQNVKIMENAMSKIDGEIELGTFDYAKYFPESKNINKPGAQQKTDNEEMAFDQFAQKWYRISKIEWKYSTQQDFYSIMENHLIPHFKKTDISTITKIVLKEFRVALALKDGRSGRKMSNKRINNIMAVLRLIINEACDEFNLRSPFEKIEPLSIVQQDINPFSPTEVKIFLKGVRQDFGNYYKTRFFSGMRTAEIDGLKWKYVDFRNKKILIRETWQRKRWDTPKTKSSIRDIKMSPIVEEALREQHLITRHLALVFANKKGNPLDHNLVTKRVWYPTLKKLDLQLRTPYQTRHTAATLWLASGENPEWIAKQMGHSSTEMLFTKYSKFVPNLTRRDGSAFESFLENNITDNNPSEKENDNENND
jgi:integrase